MNEHEHECKVCGVGWPSWCCRHRWTIGYTAVVVTILLLMSLAEYR